VRQQFVKDVTGESLFASSDAGTVTVASSGLVTGVSRGTDVVTVSFAAYTVHVHVSYDDSDLSQGLITWEVFLKGRKRN
jgi:hypothetical protein